MCELTVYVRARAQTLLADPVIAYDASASIVIEADQFAPESVSPVHAHSPYSPEGHGIRKGHWEEVRAYVLPAR